MASFSTAFAELKKTLTELWDAFRQGLPSIESLDGYLHDLYSEDDEWNFTRRINPFKSRINSPPHPTQFFYKPRSTLR